MNLKQLFAFKGRLNRKPFIIHITIGYVLILLNIFLLAFFALFLSYDPSNLKIFLNLLPTPILIIFAIITCVVVLFIFANMTRRFKDLNKGFRWAIIMLALSGMPIIYFPCLLYLCAKRGTIGPNEYGEDPLGVEAPTENQDV